jgi:hypothetical protein
MVTVKATMMNIFLSDLADPDVTATSNPRDSQSVFDRSAT